MTCHFVSWCALSQEAQAAWVQAIGSIAAVFVAVFVWWRQAFESSRSAERSAAAALEVQKRSMEPHISFARETFLESDKKPTGRISMANNGVGPAIIESIEVYLDGKIFEGDPGQKMLSLRKQIAPLGWGGGYLPGIGDWVPSGQRMTLFELRLSSEDMQDGTDADDNKRLNRRLDRVGFKVCYSTVFKDGTRPCESFAKSDTPAAVYADDDLAGG